MNNEFRHLRVSLSLLALCAAVAAALLVAGPAAAAGNYTCPPNTGADVQTGISDGGTVYIHGTCHGNFFIDANNALNVTLIGLGTNPTLNGDGNGPVLAISGPANVTIKNLTLTNGDGEVGGGIDASFGCDETDSICGTPNVTVIGSKITGNTAFYGGGIYFEDCGDLTVSNSTISNNSATDGDGGGLLVEDCPFLTMTGTTVTKNTASHSGGGLALYSAEGSIDSSTFSSNTAQDGFGGGIESQFSDLQLTNSRLLSNWAYEYGGGIDFGDSQACEEAPAGHGPGHFTPHHAADPIPAQCVGASSRGNQPVDIPQGLTIGSSTVDHNTAAHAGGGGISTYAVEGDTPTTITGSTISNNIAPGTSLGGESGGGGFEQDAVDFNADTTITSSKIYGNTSLKSTGGGIMNVAYGNGDAAVTLAGTLLQNPNSLSVGNQSKYGGGIYNAGALATVSVNAQSRIYRNKASSTGGGVYNDCGAGLFVSPGALISMNMPNNVFTSAGCLIVP
jgi:hypothetical protein